jgi:hypothetical protein
MIVSGVPFIFGKPGFQNYALFGAGYGSPFSLLVSTSKYLYANSSVLAGTNLGVELGETGAAGNETVGIFASGGQAQKYTYLTNIRVTGTNLVGNSNGGPAASANSTRGIFTGGGGPATTNVAKYTFSGDTATSGTALNVGRRNHGATGNATVGIHAGGQSGDDYLNTLTSTKYTYSSDTVVAGTNFASNMNYQKAVGNPTYGIFQTSDNASVVTAKYTYSGDTRTAGTSLTLARGGSGAAGDGTVGIFAGGRTASDVNSAQTMLYTYSDESTSTGTSLETTRSYHGGVSSSPGGL